IATTLTAVTLTGCVAGHNAKQGASSVLRYALQEEPTSLDPALSEAYTTSELLQNIYEGLTILDQNSKAGPGIAERWDVSADGKTWTFHIRPNARFHAPFDRPVAAADVKYTYERFLWPETKSPIAGPVLADIEGADDVMSGKQRELRG